MRGFFHESTLISSRNTAGLLPRCGACGFYKTCQTPKMHYSGKGKRGILIVGEFPTHEDDVRGRHFTSEAGQLLEETLGELGVNMREDCWLTNAYICAHGNATNKQKKLAVEHCRPNLVNTVRELRPTTIILLGQYAVQAYITHVWKASPGSISRWVGWQIPCQKPNVWIHPTYAPHELVAAKRIWGDRGNPVLGPLFKTHLEQAVAHTSRPWDVVPNYTKQIEVILDPDEAARILRLMREKGGPIAGDYENNILKPERKGARIVCCSMCWRGKKTIAYPWIGDAITATLELWGAENCQFIASNLKHEDRWTRKASGGTVRINWLWDSMLAAHVLDNRKGICGLKFLAFVLLGAEAYDEAISEFLESKGENHFNRVEQEVDLRQLLTYCGTDTLLEYLIAEIQMEQMAVKFPV